MSEVKQKCQLDGCNRAASTRCFCCNKNVCTRHFTEHIDAVKAQIDPLANDINTMMEKIQGLTIEQITETSFAELQQWRVDMHQLIDEIFFAKHKETEDLIENNKNKFVEHRKQQLETMVKIQDDVKQLVEDGDVTFEQIRLLRSQLAVVETNLTSFREDFLSVNAKVFAQGLVTVSTNLKKSSLPPPPPPPPPQIPTKPMVFFSRTPTSTQTGPISEAPNTAHFAPPVSTSAQTGSIFGASNTAHFAPPVSTSAQTGSIFGASNTAHFAPPVSTSAQTGSIFGASNTAHFAPPVSTSAQTGSIFGASNTAHFALPVSTSAQTGSIFGASNTAHFAPPVSTSTQTGLISGASNTAHFAPAVSTSAQTSLIFGASNTAHFAPPVSTSAQPIFGSPFAGLGVSSLNNPPTHSSPTTSTLFASAPASALPSSGVQPPFSPVRPGNNQPSFGSTSSFQFNNNRKK